MRQGVLAPYSLNPLKPLKSVLIENMGIDPRNRSKRFLVYAMDALSSVLKSTMKVAKEKRGFLHLICLECGL